MKILKTSTCGCPFTAYNDLNAVACYVELQPLQLRLSDTSDRFE